MAPSPTGEYHVGHIATLLKNYAFAKKNGGQFILRIEDTDQERLVEGAVGRIMQVIKDYGLDWDEGPGKGGPYGPYVQSERLPTYKAKAEELVAAGKAYYCFCSQERLEAAREAQRAAKVPPKYDRQCRSLSAAEVAQRLAAGQSSVIRLKVPDNVMVKFTDLIRGEIEVNWP
jgi:glutamyl-tRNA synthetase